MLNAETTQLCNNYSVMRPYVKDNSSPQQLKKRGFYMVDSSYTIPCNPNSMRDHGPLRNAEYVIQDPAEEEFLRKSQQSFRNTGSFSMVNINPREVDKMRDTLNSRCGHMRPISSYGGNPAMMNGTHTNSIFSSISKQSLNKPPNIIDKVVVVRVNDYTKNISSSIFSPSLKQTN